MQKQTVGKKGRPPLGEAQWASRQEEILDAAVKLFAEHGYSGTDTQLLADQLGVGKGTLYRYFPSKKHLFLAAADRVMRSLLEAIDLSIAKVVDPLESVTIAIRTYLAYFAEHPESVELLMQERALFKDRKKPTYFEHRDANSERWRNVWRELIAAGRVREMPVDRIRDVIGDLVYGTMFTNYFTGRRISIDAQTEEILDVVFHGVLTNAERRRRPTS